VTRRSIVRVLCLTPGIIACAVPSAIAHARGELDVWGDGLKWVCLFWGLGVPIMAVCLIGAMVSVIADRPHDRP